MGPYVPSTIHAFRVLPYAAVAQLCIVCAGAALICLPYGRGTLLPICDCRASFQLLFAAVPA